MFALGAGDIAGGRCHPQHIAAWGDIGKAIATIACACGALDERTVAQQLDGYAGHPSFILLLEAVAVAVIKDRTDKAALGLEAKVGTSCLPTDHKSCPHGGTGGDITRGYG